MADTTTLNEQFRAPLDGTESIRLATAGNNWKAQVNQPNNGGVAWPFGTISGGTSASSTLLLESTTGAGTSDSIIFKTGSQVTAGFVDTGSALNWNGKIYITPPSGESELQMHTNTGFSNFISGFKAGGLRWAIDHGNSASETGSNVGTDWQIERYNDSGVFIDVPFQITRSSGLVTIQNSLQTPLVIGGSTASSTLTLESTSGAGTSDIILFKTGSQSERVRIDTSGRITVGGVANQIGYTLELDGLTTPTSAIACCNWDSGTSDGQIEFYKSQSGTIGTKTIVTSGQFLGEIDFYGVNNATTFTDAAYLAVIADGTPGSQVPGRMIFATATTSAAATERFRIDSLGNIVIGTAALATSATSGFLYLDSCAGVPTGSPTSFTGRVPVVYDSTDSLLWFNPGGTGWISTLGGAWTQTTPTVTAVSGTFTSVSSTLRFKKVGTVAFFNITIVVTTVGTATTGMQVTLPNATVQIVACPGYFEQTLTAMTCSVNSTTLLVAQTNGVIQAGTYVCTGFYETT